MTKRYIGELQERAEAGDEEARRTLAEAGLLDGEEEDGYDEHGNNRCTSWGEVD